MIKELWKTQIPTIAGILLIIAGIAVTTLITQKGVPFISNASPSETPQNIRVTNITDASFTVSYKTAGSVLGSISYGTIGTILNNTALSDIKEQTLHAISVKNLSPSTLYFFRITSGQSAYLDSGKPFTVTTGPKITDIPPANPKVSGTVLFQSNDAKHALVYVTTANAQVLSTDVKPDGSFSLLLNTLRTNDLQSYLPLSASIPLTLLITGDNTQSQVTILPGQVSAVPSILLSQSYDFTASNNPISTPSAIAGFPLFSTSPSEIASPQILTPTKDEGFTDHKPQFSGTASPSAQVTIEIHSYEQIQTQVQANKNGTWTYRPQTALSPGNHTITITSRDQFGILKTITQNFVVYAEGSQVGQSATPSATLTPSITNAPTPLPTSILSPTLIPTVTPSVTSVIPTTILFPTPPHTSSQMPNPGNSVALYAGIPAFIATSFGIFLLLRSRGGTL